MGLTAHALGAIASIVAVHASHSVLFADGSWTRYAATAVAACAVGVGGVLIPGPGGWIGPLLFAVVGYLCYWLVLAPFALFLPQWYAHTIALSFASAVVLLLCAIALGIMHATRPANPIDRRGLLEKEEMAGRQWDTDAQRTPSTWVSSFSPPPAPADILSRYPPRVDASAAEQQGLHRGGNEAVKRLIRYQIRQGRELGVQVYAYHEGRLAIAVVGGVCRCPSSCPALPQDSNSGSPMEADVDDMWHAMEGGTLVMAYSVAKAVTSAAAVLMAGQGRLNWAQPTHELWPELCKGGPTSTGDGSVSVAEAFSHRIGLPGTPLPPWRFYRAFYAGGWSALWKEGVQWAGEVAPRWRPGERCLYHHLSWSFIVGELALRSDRQHQNGGKVMEGKEVHGQHISEVVSHTLAEAARTPGELHLGRLPAALWHRVAQLEAPPCIATDDGDMSGKA